MTPASTASRHFGHTEHTVGADPGTTHTGAGHDTATGGSHDGSTGDGHTPSPGGGTSHPPSHGDEQPAAPPPAEPDPPPTLTQTVNDQLDALVPGRGRDRGRR